MKSQRRLHSLRGKLNLLVIAVILAVAAGLLWISYVIFCGRVDSYYNERLEHAALAAADTADDTMLQHFWTSIREDGSFEAARSEAERTGDLTPLTDWLSEQPCAAAELYKDELGEDYPFWTLLEDYELLIASLTEVIDYLDVDNAYYQIDADGGIWNIADPTLPMTRIGTPADWVEPLDDGAENAVVQPTVYRSEEHGWVCTAAHPILDADTEEAFCFAAVDINMTHIMEARRSFLVNSLLFVLILTVLAILLCTHLMNRIAIHPLRELAKAATRFGRDDDGYTRADIMQLDDIRTQDEIRTLYDEMRSMQTRIVDYTDHLTAITAERERTKTELRTAAGIQDAMIPHSFPQRPEYELYATMTPAKEVGGDFYDFFEIDSDHLGLVIADVSDKGVPAALYMMASKILLNYRASMSGSPSEILGDVNWRICRGVEGESFVTIWLGILDLRTGLMTCANAGHEYPTLCGPDGEFRVLKDRHGMVVGAFENSRYTDYTIQLHPGDLIFVYTDGVPDAINEADEFYGLERLTATLNRTVDRTPKAILRFVREDIRAFAGSAQQFDDMTMLCLKYDGRRDT